MRRDNAMKGNEPRKRLRETEREMWAEMTRTEAEARTSGIADTQDGDAAAERKETLLQKPTADRSVFTHVREALQRTEKGAYGKCVDYGRPIEGHRLTSVPWTSRCIGHEKRHDDDLAARPAQVEGRLS